MLDYKTQIILSTQRAIFGFQWWKPLLGRPFSQVTLLFTLFIVELISSPWLRLKTLAYLLRNIYNMLKELGFQ